MRSRFVVLIAILFAAGSVAPRPVAAFGHLWDITEVYSNADGTVQFIELESHTLGENGLSLMFLRSTGGPSQYHFPTDLAASSLDNHLLVATAAFASLPGAVIPDYVMPDGFVHMAGDTIELWSEGSYFFSEILWDSFAFGTGSVLPTNGIDSLKRPFGTGVISAGLNTPTNSLGQAGGLTPVPEPGSAWLLGAALAAIGLTRRRACGTGLRARSRP